MNRSVRWAPLIVLGGGVAVALGWVSSSMLGGEREASPGGPARPSERPSVVEELSDGSDLIARMEVLEARMNALEARLPSAPEEGRAAELETEDSPGGPVPYDQRTQILELIRSELLAWEEGRREEARYAQAEQQAVFLSRAYDLDEVARIELDRVLRRVRAEALMLERAVAPGGKAPLAGSPEFWQWMKGWASILEWSEPQIQVLLGLPPSNATEGKRAALAMASSGLAPPPPWQGATPQFRNQ